MSGTRAIVPNSFRAQFNVASIPLANRADGHQYTAARVRVPAAPVAGAGPALASLAPMTEPGGSGPIGPYPPGVETDEQHDEYDRLRRRVLWKMPSGLYVLGSTDTGERRNGMTINWVTQVSFDPKWIGVSIEQTAVTHELIEAGGCFGLSLIDLEDRAIVRKFTKPVEVDLTAKTLNGIPYVEKVTGAPILSQAVAYVDCAVRETVSVGDHTLFIGEVMDTAFFQDEDTAVLRMEDTRMNYGG